MNTIKISKLLFSTLFLWGTMANAQNLTISSTGETGISGTNWSITGTTLTVIGTASVDASVIENALANGNLSVLGNSTNFVVTVSEAINSTTAGNGLTIGSMTNSGAITIGADISLAGGIAIMGGDVQLNGNITSTATGDLFFQGLDNAWSIRLATGKTIEKTDGTGLLTMQGNGRINNSTSVGSILASGTAKLDVVIINEMDEGTAGLYNVSTGNITTNGGHLWISAGAKTLVWNGLSVGSTGVPGNTNYNGIDVTGNISTSGGDILLWAFVGSGARGNGYGDITAISSNRTISSGSGNITLLTRYNDFVNSTPDININTSGKLTLAPASGASFDVTLAFSGSTTTGTFTGSGGMGGLIIENFTSINELVIGTYNGTGKSGDTPYTPANKADITLGAVISITGPITAYGGDITVSQNLTSTLAGADILLQATGAINLSASMTIQTNVGDVTLNATSGGTATIADSAIYLNTSSQILSNGGNITLGGGYSGTEGNLYAATTNMGGGYAVRMDAATILNAAGGNINIYGRNVLSYGDGIYLSAVNISTTGSGTIGIYGDSYGGYNGTTFFGGVTFETNASTLQTVNGNITLKGVLTQSQSTQGYGINFYRSSGSAGQTRHIQILSQTGDIQITGDRGSSTGGGIGHSSWGNIYFGSPSDNSFTASGDVVLTYSNLVNAGSNGFKVKTTGAVTYEPVATSFIAAQTYPANANYILADNASSLTIGKTGNTVGVTIGSDISIAGPISVYAGTITLNANLTTTNTTTGNINLNGTTISGTGNMVLADGRTAEVNVSSASTYDGIISGTGSGLTKAGAGLVTLTKDHTYTGATTISAGDLQLGTGGSVSQASSGMVSNTSGVAVASSSKLILSPNENIIFAAPISGAGGIEIKGMSGRYLNTWLSGTPILLAANTTVLEALTRITGGLMGGNAIAGGSATCGAYQKYYTALTNTGTLQLQVYNGVSPTYYTKCVFVKLTQSGSDVMIQANTTILGTGAGYRNGNVLGADISVGGSSMVLATVSGTTGYGISEVYLSGKVNFTGNLTYTGNTELSNTITNVSNATNISSYTSKGTQEIKDASSSFPAASTVVNNGLVIFNRATPLTISSNIEGTEEVLQVGADITLTGTNTHTGITTIDLNKKLNIGSGSTTGSITGNVVNYGTLTFDRSDASTHTGIISGSGSLVKSGAGAHTLTGLNTYTGATTINAGKLVLERDVPITSSSSYSGAGTLVIQPSSSSFTSAVSYPIAGFTVSNAIGGLTIGKLTNTANITFGNTTTIAGSITAYGGTITANANLTTTSASNSPILLQGSKVIHNQGVSVQTNGSDITYDVTNSPWTAEGDQGILLGTANGSIATINAQGGNISLTASFASSGITNTSTLADVAILMRNSLIKTSASGTVTLNGNAYDNASTNGDFIWGIMLHTNEVIQTEHGAISITGTGGKTNGNARGIIADNTALKVLSVSGPITFTEVMPNGHSVSNHTGTYFKPAATNAIKIGADGTLVTNSTSNVVFDVARITFDGTIAPTVVNTSGKVTIQPVGNQFENAVSLAGLSISNTATGLTIGKPTNTSNVTFANAITIAGPITAYGGTITLNANLTTTNSGNISLYTDNPLEGLSTARTLSAAGAFKYIPRGTAFTAAVTYPIANLSATCTGLTIGNVTNDNDITINADVEGGAGIELYGNNLAINSNLKTTSSADMYLKGNTIIAANKHIESNGDFTHDGNLTFKSDITGTAAFGALGGTFTKVNGTATVERYIPAKRGWRLLTAPVKGSTNNTIPANWQGVNGEGLLLFSPATYQTQTMTGYTLGGGMPNIWKYNNVWQAIPNLTNENLFTTTGTNGFLVFATGTSDSNTIVLGETATTLKPQGQLITGEVVNSIIGNQYNLVPNPYASALNTETMVQANAGSKVWMVDPSLGNFGGYTTYDGTNWAPTTPTVSDKNIQSGQAFFVRTASNSTFSITESHKISGSSNTWFSRTANSPADKIRVLLYKQDNAEWKLADGILAVNSASGNNEVDNTDTGKMSNFNENLLFRNGTSNLAIEYRGLPTAGTTQPMRLTGTTVQPYQLKVKAESYTNTNLQPYIQDTQLGTVTAIPTDGSEIVLPFTGVAASSTNPDSRFIIIYLSTLSTNNPDVLSVGVYPNPVNTGVFTVSLKENTTPANYSLTNLLGQQVQVGKLMSLNNSVNVTSLQIGIYILQVEQEGKTFSTKLIIK